ncbi:MAG TPA: putative nucleotidyltransferase substrate binding domain-containing protein [Actinomycetota bacterium]
MDIAGFLGRYPPFDALTHEHLAEIAGSVEIEHFAAGVTILQQGGEPATAQYVIRKGAVELLDDGQLLDLLVEGELFGQFSLLAHESPTLTVRAQEDTLCYLVPAEVADAVLGSHAGMAFVIGSMRRRITSAIEAAANAPDRRLTTIGELVRRDVVTTPPSTSVADAAALMAAERVSSLLIPVHEGWAIVTDRDLRTKVVAVRAGSELVVGEIATFPARMLPAQTLAGEALLSMFADGVHHFPVTDPHGKVIGVVTDTDLMGLGRHTPFAAKSAIERARTDAEVAEAGRELPQVVTTMVDARADPIDVGRVVSLIVDALTERLLQLAIAEHGDPPCAWAWLALGSAARHEQALRTDQDHALAYDPVEGQPDPDPYFAKMAEFVTAGLEAAGIPRCNGDAMATHPALRRPLDGFVDMFAEWMDRADQQATVLSSIGYDFRQVSGPLDAEPALVEAVRRARARPIFVRQLSRRALDLSPPTGFFRDLVVHAKGEHAGHLDIKHGGITIVNNLARVWAVRTGVAAKGTIARLSAAAVAGGMDTSVASELSEAFHFLWDVRLRHQVDQVKAGVAPDDFIDPKELASFSRSGLKEAFRAITRAQRLLRSEEGLQPR